MSKKEILWTDMHSNLHHEDFRLLPKWFAQVKELMDFWPIAYYPYYMKTLPSGMGVEDVHEEAAVKKDWEELRAFVNRVNAEGYPMFMGYEWQGAGLDGDHNVFFLDNEQDICFPLRYQQLYELYKDAAAIAIPHHLAYQSNNRGKNWDTHIEAFSPFAEVYSSHGSSENDDGDVAMSRHVHMGPRVGTNSVESGLSKGYRFGLIASGDNHAVPAMAQFGSMALISEGRSKEEIWKAMNRRHVYGVSDERIQLEFTVNEAMMGDLCSFDELAQVRIDVTGSNALDRIEVIADNEVVRLIDCNRSRQLPKEGVVRFKWKLELGWGPDRRIFPEISSKRWQVALKTQGRLLSAEKCWNSFGQRVISQSEAGMELEMTTYKTTQSGKWMGVSAVTTEGMIFEIEDDIDHALSLSLDGKEYLIPIRQILRNSTLISLDEEVAKLLYDTYQETSFYRNDTWWHNSYKCKVHRGALQSAYQQSYAFVMDLREVKQLRLRVHQKNGCMAWSSPIFNDGKERS